MLDTVCAGDKFEILMTDFKSEIENVGDLFYNERNEFATNISLLMIAYVQCEYVPNKSYWNYLYLNTPP